MKKLILAILLCMSSIVYAGETGWYIGYGFGKSNLKYDTNTEINESIKRQGYEVPLDLLALRGHQLILSSDLSSSTEYFTIGYRLSQAWSFEAQSGYLGTFSVNGKFHVNESGTLLPSSYPITTHAVANAFGTAKISDTKFISLSALYTISDARLVEPYLRVGVGYLEGTLSTYYKYDYNYGSSVTDEISGSFEEAKSDNYRVPMGIVGIGLRVNLNKKTEIRFEFQRVGFVLKDPSIDMYTFQLIRLF